MRFCKKQKRSYQLSVISCGGWILFFLRLKKTLQYQDSFGTLSVDCEKVRNKKNMSAFTHLGRLSATIILCLFSSVFAYSGGSGTATDPYLIATPADLDSLGATSGDWWKCFKLVADINMAEFTGTQYKIIGNDTTKFTGTFDGNDHTIRNLAYTTTIPVNYVGIFGKALNATIKNLGIEDVNFSVLSNYSGSLAGYASYCTISNCYSTGKVVAMLSGSSSYCSGGLVGYQDYGKIINCHSTVSVTSVAGNIGGLVGYQNYGEITNCYSTWPVICPSSAFSSMVGGLVGYQNYGNITNCYSTGAVTNSSPPPSPRTGGLVGYRNNGTITNCYAAGAVSGTFNVGGLVGYSFGSAYSGTNIKNCYATGAVSGTSNVGGLVGYNVSQVRNSYATGAVSGSSNVGGFIGYHSSELFNCFWDTETSGRSIGVGSYPSATGVTGKITADMKKLSTFASAGWKIADINGVDTDWIMLADGQDYPKLNYLFCHDCFTAIPLSGSGTEADPYQIQSAADFVALGEYCNAWDKYIVLMADIDLNGFVIRPIGNSMVRFTGNFNGQGFIIRNARMDMPNKNYVGLFGRVGNGGIIADLGVEDVNIVGKKFVGGLIGFNSGTISNCYSTGDAHLNSSSFAGGLIGFSAGGTISDCNSAVNISGSGAAIGGLVGGNGKRNIILSCYAAGAITDSNSNKFDSCAGGLIGSNAGKIYDSYATGSIAATFNSSSAYVYLGGMVGDNTYGTISGCYATGDISVTSNPSTAAISAGGLVGLNKSGDVNDYYSTGQIIFDCSDGSKYMIGGVVGLNCGESINRCYSKCAIGSGASAEADCSVGGVAGLNMDGVVSGCFWDIQTSGKTASGGGKGLTTEQMKAMLIYQNAGWAGNGWVMNDGVDYPRLEWENTFGVPIPDAEPIPLIGSGTEAEPYQVWTATDFAYLSWYKSVLDKHIILMVDIDLANIRVHPISEFGPFTGSFDGDGHIIKNVCIYEPTNSYIGLFGRVGTGGVVKNVDIRHANIVGGDYTGGLIGKSEGGTISRCGTTGTVDGFVCVGGLIGKNETGTLSQCFSKVDVTAWDANGFTSCAGGLIGYNNSEITNGYATGDVICRYSSISFAGGLVGRQYYCANIRGCYSAGYISATGKKVYKGGLLGYFPYDYDYYPLSYIRGCYWDKQTSGTSDGVGSLNPDPAGVIGKTTVQMKSGVTDLLIWKICVGTNYPKLAWQIPLAGDFGCPDGVDIYDLAVFVDQWLFEELSYDLHQDNQNIVNFLDFGVIANNWSGDDAQLAGFAAEWLQRDAGNADIAPAAGGDGVVNFLDFAALAENWMIEQ